MLVALDMLRRSLIISRYTLSMINRLYEVADQDGRFHCNIANLSE